MQEFASGFGTLVRGFGFWRSRSGVMWLGIVPAVLAWFVLLAALVGLGLALPGLLDWATPFADGWDPLWRNALRVSAGILVFAGAAVLAAVSFTALALVLGDPIYERIHLAVEEELGGELPESSGFWRTVVDALQLVGLGLLIALAAWIVGLIPVVGGVLGGVLGFVLTGRLLARELTSRPFEARGLPLETRRRLLARRPWRVLGFGVAVNLCFLVPLGAVAAMPAAIAGATVLARGLLDEDAAAGTATRSAG
nr:EI24 domain-containing protein [Agromyces seonyuensis]